MCWPQAAGAQDASSRTELSLPLITHSGASCSYETVDLADVVDACVPPRRIAVSASDSAVVPAVVVVAVVVPLPLPSGAPNVVSFAQELVDAMLVVSRAVVGTASVVGGLVVGTGDVAGAGLKKGLFSVTLTDGATVGAGVTDDAAVGAAVLSASCVAPTPAVGSRGRELARWLGAISPSSSTTVRVTDWPDVHAFLMRSTAARLVFCTNERAAGRCAISEVALGCASVH